MSTWIHGSDQIVKAPTKHYSSRQKVFGQLVNSFHIVHDQRETKERQSVYLANSVNCEVI